MEPYFRTQLTTMYLGDCLEVMDYLISLGVKVDAIITDLPYGVTSHKWDSIIPFDQMWDRIKKLRKDRTPILLFAMTPFDKALGYSNIKEMRYDWIWEKVKASGHINANKQPMRAHENILVFYDKAPLYTPQKTTGHKPVNAFTKTIESQNKSEVYRKATSVIVGKRQTDRYPRSVLKYPIDRPKDRYHPTQKPLELIKYLLKTYTNEGDLVLDFTSGAFTTSVACEQLGRKSIGIEIEQRYCDIGIHRIEEMSNNE